MGCVRVYPGSHKQLGRTDGMMGSGANVEITENILLKTQPFWKRNREMCFSLATSPYTVQCPIAQTRRAKVYLSKCMPVTMRLNPKIATPTSNWYFVVGTISQPVPLLGGLDKSRGIWPTWLLGWSNVFRALTVDASSTFFKETRVDS